MDGVQILNTFEPMAANEFRDCAMIIGEICLIIIVFTVIDRMIKLTITLAVVIVACSYIGITQPANALEGIKRYEVLLEDTVSYEKLTEKFKVIEQRGDIWVLEEKAHHETSLLSGGEGK